MCAAAAVLPFEASSGEGAVPIAPGLLEEIRDRVLDGYAAAPHGGVELGFVLLGRKESGGVSIEHFRPIPCAHLLGPRFLLSPEEESHFPEWIRTLSADPQLEGAELVGWCCSHHRSDLALLEREIAFHHRFFPEGDHVVMVVKPQSMQAILAGIFLPDENGAIHGESPAIHLRSAMLDSMFNGEPKTADDRVPNTINSSEARKRLRPVDAERMRPINVERKMRVEGQKKRFRFSAWWIGVAAGAAVLAALLTVGFTRGFHLIGAARPAPSLAVAIRPQGNDLVFTWTGNIRNAKSAGIEVLDGGATSRFDVTSDFQPAGVFVFPHKTGNVQAVLTVRTKAGNVVRSIGFVDGRASAENRDRVQAGYESDAAARLDATNRRLSALVSILQSRREQHGK